MAQVRECADGLTPRPRGPRPRAGGLEGEVCTYWGVYRPARSVVGKYFVAILGAERMINSITLGESSCTVRRHGQLVQAAKGFCVNVRWRRGALHGLPPQCRAPFSPTSMVFPAGGHGTAAFLECSAVPSRPWRHGWARGLVGRGPYGTAPGGQRDDDNFFLDDLHGVWAEEDRSTRRE